MAAAPKRSVTVKDVAPDAFIKAYAEHLKKSGKIELPKWVDIAKTASFKQMCPNDPDWYYVRAASIARKVYIRGGTGVGGLRKAYGGANKRGTRRAHSARAAGGVIRHILIQLESIQVVEAHPAGGRRITSRGQRDLDRIAATVA